MTQPLFFAVAMCASFALFLNWRIELRNHTRRLQNKKLRIHVNGIRGKSTVTRLVAAILRSSNYQTVGKTTGSAACVINEQGLDVPIQRAGAPTILEQIEIIRSISPNVDALVIECMAIKPEYQKICEEVIVQSNIGIITNVREDHQDVLGETLEEIAANLLLTCPTNGILITSEQNPSVLRLFRDVAANRNTRLVLADSESVSDDELMAFDYVGFKDNISIGFELAKILGVEREQALNSMVAAPPDPGVFEIKRMKVGERQVIWADMFAVNDRQSVILGFERLNSFCSDETAKIGLLNNRSDREDRALRFAKIAAQDLDLDLIGLLGAYEHRIANELSQNGWAEEKTILLGSHRKIPDERLVQKILEQAPRDRDVLLVGMVNIHTQQADVLRKHFQQPNLQSKGRQ